MRRLPPLAALALLSAGCAADTGTVAGTVRYRGQPVAGGSVVLYCADKQIVRGLIGTDGRYAIPNVPRGIAAVTVQTHARVPDGMRFPQQLPPTADGPLPPDVAPRAGDKAAAIPPRYALPDESGLSVAVTGGTVPFDIRLTP